MGKSPQQLTLGQAALCSQGTEKLFQGSGVPVPWAHPGEKFTGLQTSCANERHLAIPETAVWPGGDEARAYIQVLGSATAWELHCSSLQRNCDWLLFSEDSAVGKAFAVISLLFAFHFLGALSLSLAINYNSWWRRSEF